MELSAFIGFALIALALIAVPGADWAYILSISTQRRSIAPAVAGLSAGYILITVAVAGGLGALIVAMPAAMTALTVAGAGYLIYLGIKILGAASSRNSALEASAVPAQERYFVRGMAVSGLNPKGLLIFLAILPQFASQAWPWPIAAQLGVLGAAYVVICALFYLVLGFTAGRVFSSRPSANKIMMIISGLAMILVGLSLVVEKLIHAVEL